MRVKTSELSGPALDWAVAKAQGIEPVVEVWPSCVAVRDQHGNRLMYSQAWVQGGPIIERERIALALSRLDDWWTATKVVEEYEDCWSFADPSLLVAAMRCYVASKLGDEMDVPEALS